MAEADQAIPRPRATPSDDGPALPDTGEVVGICLSGGGLRAAAFGLGVLQGLDEARELLLGPTAARYLAAVSGGSYTAGAVTCYLQSARLPGGVEPSGRPFAPGSAEAALFAEQSGYLRAGGTVRLVVQVAGRVAAGLAVSLSVLLFPAVVTALLGASVAGLAEVAGVSAPDQSATSLTWLVAAAGTVAWVWVIRHLVRGGAVPLWGNVLFLAWLSATAPSLVVATIDATAWARSEVSLRDAALVAVVVLLVSGARVELRATRAEGRPVPVRALEWATEAALRVAQLTVLILSGVVLAAVGSNPTGSAAGVAVVGLLLVQGFVAFHGAGDIHSLFWFYRRRLSLFWTVLSTADGPATIREPHGILLSQLRPVDDPARRTPELLVCTTANIRVDTGQTTPADAVSLVFGASEVVLRLDPPATVPTSDYERFMLPTSLSGDVEPAVTLSAAIALSGAAAAPAMGRYPTRALRTLFTLLNIRLGRWLPNPSDPSNRAALAAHGGPIPIRLGARELLREAFAGIGRSDPIVYVSDGGHDDNTGIVELLRRGCDSVIAVDSSADQQGSSRAVDLAVGMAKDELDVCVDIDLAPFRSGRPRGHRERTSVAGTIHYPDGRRGRLLVLKLGTSPATEPSVASARQRWRRFPFHSTLNQFFTSDKFEAYRALGLDSCRIAMREEAQRRTDVADLPGPV